MRAQLIARAQQAPCSNFNNALYIIDNKYVFSAVAGSCAEGDSESRTLSAFSPAAQQLCSAGFKPGMQHYTGCTDPSARPLFNAIQADSVNLGLGAEHRVEQIHFLPKDGTNMSVTVADTSKASSIRTARNVVVRDERAMATLWAEHTGGMATKPRMPLVRFDRQMVIGRFAGDSADCREVSMRRVAVAGTRIVAEYEERAPAAGSVCASPLSSMELVLVDRSDAQVDFVAVKPARIAHTTLESPRLYEPFMAVIKDKKTWNALWIQNDRYSTPQPLPVVDFTKNMLIAVAIGGKNNGCPDVTISDIERINGKIRVNVHEQIVGPFSGVLCAATMTGPTAVVQIPRSDEPVEFSHQIRPIRSYPFEIESPPADGSPWLSRIIDWAQLESCATLKNRVFIIDKKYVFHEVAGTCWEGNFTHQLSNANTVSPLCTEFKTFAGYGNRCDDESMRPMFNIILANRNRPDLGLGAQHKVEEIPIVPRNVIHVARQR